VEKAQVSPSKVLENYKSIRERMMKRAI